MVDTTHQVAPGQREVTKGQKVTMAHAAVEVPIAETVEVPIAETTEVPIAETVACAGAPA